MNAQQLKNSILQEAIMGKLVPQDPNDEPASVLLDKIRKEKARLVKEGKLKKKDLEETPISEDEKPFEIPESWEWVRLKNIVVFLGGYAYDSNSFISTSNNQVLRLGNVKNDNILLNINPVFIDEKLAQDTEKYKCKENDILITMTGTRKKRDYFFSALVNQSHHNLYINQRVGCLRSINENIAKWLIIALKAESTLTDVFQYETGTANQGNLGADNILKTKIPLPPLAEQHRIVAKIEELLPKVEEYGKAQEALDKLNEELPEKLKKSILQEAISGKLVPQDPNDEPASVLLDKIRKEKARLVKEGKLKKKDLEETPISEDEKPFEIPESWEWNRIGYLANLYTGNSISKEVKESRYMNVKGRWYIATKDVNFDNSIDYDNGVYIPKYDELQFKIALSGSILMCIEGGSAGRKIGVLDRDVFFGNKLCCFYSYGVYNKFLYYYLQTSNFKELFNNNKKGIIGGVSINMMLPLLIPVPPLAEQHRIVAKIEQLMKEIDKLNNKS